jgi:hypothetical protein
MSKDPAFLFYSADFLVGVMDLTDEETGQYIKLICLQHQKGRLKEESIKRMFPNISAEVLGKFEIDDNGLYYNPRVEEEIEKRERYIDSRSANGSKGCRPNKCAETIKKPYGLAYEKHSENENENIINNLSNNDYTNIRQNNIDSNYYIEMFTQFWCAYPKKRDKERAQKIFLRIKPSTELFAQMMNALESQIKSKQWQDRQYIPYPSTWLNGKRWEDEVTESERSESTFDTDEFFELAVQRGMRK